MHLKAVLPYAATPNAQIVDLPYGGAAFSMTVAIRERVSGTILFVGRVTDPTLE